MLQVWLATLEVQISLSFKIVPPSQLSLPFRSFSVQNPLVHVGSPSANCSSILSAALGRGESEIITKNTTEKYLTQAEVTYCSQRAPPRSRARGCCRRRGAPRRASRCGCRRSSGWPPGSEGSEAAHCGGKGKGRDKKTNKPVMVLAYFSSKVGINAWESQYLHLDSVYCFLSTLESHEL